MGKMRKHWCVVSGSLVSKIRRPREKEPANCEASALYFIFDLCLQWNRDIFGILTLLDPLKGQSLSSHVSCLRSCWMVYCTQKATNRPQPDRDSGSGMTPESRKIHQFSNQSPRQQKPRKVFPKIVPKATQNHGKSALEAWEIQLLRKFISAIPSMPKACFAIPEIQIQTQKISEKTTWK